VTGSTHTDRGHLTPETVADLREGLLDARATLAAQGHLLDCRRCAALSDDLAQVSALLADHGDIGDGPDALPDDVAERLDAALAAERPAERPAAATTVTPLREENRGPAGMRVLQAAAVIVLVLAGVGIGVNAFRAGGGNDTATTADSAGGAAREEAAAGGGYPVTRSGRNWSAATLGPAVPSLVTGSLAPASDAAAPEAGGNQGSGPKLSSDEVGRLAGGPPLADCVTALADGPETPLAVDLSSWQGNPAAVVVLPTPDDPAAVDVWVVGPECSQADAKLLYFARVARP
jgi:hypothetical protein